MLGRAVLDDALLARKGLGGGKTKARHRVKAAVHGAIRGRTLPSVLVQIPLKFGSRNEDAAKPWELTKDFPAHKPSDSFLAHPQFGRAGFHVERLTLDWAGCIHNTSLKSHQGASRPAFRDVSATQSRWSAPNGDYTRSAVRRACRIGSVSSCFSAIFCVPSSGESGSVWQGAWFLVRSSLSSISAWRRINSW